MEPGPEVLVEACVTTVEEAVRCADGGAGRVELCVNLEVGGLTPPVELVREVSRAIDIPVFVMIRPRAGRFVHTPDEIEAMHRQIEAARSEGADGIVLGPLRSDGSVDGEGLTRLARDAAPLPVTFHRAFDRVPDPAEALEALVDAGVARVLTSGGANTAREGAEVLAALIRRGRGRLQVMPGGGVRADHAKELVRRTGATELHARASAVPALVRALAAG